MVVYYNEVLNDSVDTGLSPAAARDLLYSVIAVKKDIEVKTKTAI